MAFRRLKYYSPNFTSVDPRIDSNWFLNSTSCVISISPYPTFKSMITNDSGGVSNTRMLGLISDMSRAEVLNIGVHYDIGNKNPIFIPGKMSGQLSLSSNTMECVNLLGGIYETLLTAFEHKYPGNRFKELKEKILYLPKLNDTYFEDPSKQSRKEQGGAVAVQATPDGIEEEEIRSNLGSILMSLSDIRTRLKFGLCFIIFQSEDRLSSDVDFSINTSSIDALEGRDVLQNSTLEPTTSGVNYRILSGIFLENCIINSYSNNINANSPISAPIESVSMLYSSVKNIKQNIKVIQ